MFRSNVLKTTRLTNQVVSATRNSFQHQPPHIRFNSVTIDRVLSDDVNNNNSSLSFTNSIKNVAEFNNKVNEQTARSQQQKQNNKNNNRNRNRNNNNNSNNNNNNNNGGKRRNQGTPAFYLNKQSPWYNQLAAFQEALVQAVDLTEPANQVFFWEHIKKAMSLYKELKGTPDLNDSLIGLLTHTLHIGLRSNRSQLTRLSKKPDYDAKSFHTDLQTFIKLSLREIRDDLLGGIIPINETGAMHILTSLKELKLENEAVQLWSGAMQMESLKTIFLQQKCVGVLLPIIYQSGTTFEDVENLYKESKATKATAHPFLISGMIKTCLAANEYHKALEYFDEMCNIKAPFAISALVDVHLAFIGESKNISIATKFFEKAVNKEVPYDLTLQVNNVKQFIDNIWLVERDFDKVLDVWVKATTFYGRNIHHGISSSLNNTFFEIFFDNYSNEKNAGLDKLQQLISTYNEIKPIDEPFFNIIISKCTIWKDKATIDALYSAYDLYNLPKSSVSRRIYLKSLGSVPSTDDEILEGWLDLLKNNDAQGYTYIANADWAALRDATIGSQHAALDSSANRDLLYVQILRKYQYYCRDESQFYKMNSIGNLFPQLNKYLQNSSLDTSNIPVPKFHNLVCNNF